MIKFKDINTPIYIYSHSARLDYTIVTPTRSSLRLKSKMH